MQGEPPEASQPPLVLVVDDEPDLREVMVFVLLEKGFRVVEARDGREAVELACRDHPALIVLDMNLPILSGEEVAATLRGMMTEVPPILVVTASGSAAERAKRAQAADYLEKPFSVDDLVVAATRLVRPTPTD
jgi:CheY-like chemotaxis protein